VTERLNADGISADTSYLQFAGRYLDGSGWVSLVLDSNVGSFGSPWPEWAYGVAEWALHFKKQMWIIYNTYPFGNNLIQVFCLNTPVS
jgi:hypothetical protein